MAILIAESGSSKTDWRFVGNNGGITQIKTIGFNPYYQDEESIFNEINLNVAPKITEKIDSIFYYGTGITNIEKAKIIENALKRVFSEAVITVKDDLIAAARALCLNETGIACILGTGSNSCLFDGEKIVAQVPSLGFWLGDEGGGGYLGKELIKRYIRQELPPEIYQKFVSRYGQLERTEILDKAYRQPFPNRYFSSFSKFLFDNRYQPYIYQLVYDAFLLFFEKNVLKYENYESNKVHFTGSIAFYYSDILKKAAKKYNITIGVIMESPIAGLALYHKTN
jgi:glucosamine kinase